MYILNIPMLQAAASQGAGGSLGGIIMIVLMIVIFYFFMIRPQSKKQKEIKKAREALAVGDSVVTAGGIHGKIRKISDTSMMIEISNGVQIKVEKSSIYPAGEEPAAPGQQGK